MKRYMIFIILLISVISITACGSTKKEPANKEQVREQQNEIKKTEVKSPETKETNAAEEITKDNSLDPLAGGKIKGLEFGIGSKIKDMVQKIGKPVNSGTTDGNFFYMYDKVTYFSDSTLENGGSISAIAVRDDRDICGVKVGLKPADIKSILGQPKDEGDDDGQNWVILYEVKDGLILSFFSPDKDSPTVAALLKME